MTQNDGPGKTFLGHVYTGRTAEHDGTLWELVEADNPVECFALAAKAAVELVEAGDMSREVDF